MKLNILPIILIISAVSFAGCSKKDIANTEEDKSNSGQPNYTFADSINKSVDIPDDYPNNILPVYKNGTVIAVSEQQGGYALAILSDDSIKKISDFYKPLIKDASIIMNTEEESLYEVMGSMEDYTFTVTVSENTETDDFKNSITLIVFPGSMPSYDINSNTPATSGNTEESLENPNISDDYEIASGVVMPKNYSSKDVPIYGSTQAKVCIAMDKDPSGNSVVVFGYVSEFTKEEILEFYKNRYSNAAIKEIPDGQEISGTVNGKNFSIAVQNNDPSKTKTDSSYKTMVSVNIF